MDEFNFKGIEDAIRAPEITDPPTMLEFLNKLDPNHKITTRRR
jgi:hypothetical protein